MERAHPAGMVDMIDIENDLRDRISELETMIDEQTEVIEELQKQESEYEDIIQTLDHDREASEALVKELENDLEEKDEIIDNAKFIISQASDIIYNITSKFGIEKHPDIIKILQYLNDCERDIDNFDIGFFDDVPGDILKNIEISIEE